MHREEDYFSTNRLLGTLAGKPERAAFLEARYREANAALAGERPHPSDRPKVLYLWQTEPIGPVDGSSIYSLVIERAGGDNVAAGLSRYTIVDMEQVLAWNPSVILMFCCGRTNPSNLFKSELWSQVDAVRDRRVYKVPIGGTRFADMVEGPLFARWLAELLFPGMERKLRSEMRRVYADVYGYDLTDDELDNALQIGPNAASAGYERFRR